MTSETYKQIVLVANHRLSDKNTYTVVIRSSQNFTSTEMFVRSFGASCLNSEASREIALQFAYGLSEITGIEKVSLDKES